MKKLLSKLLDIVKHPRGWSLIVFYALFAATLAAAISLVLFAPGQTVLHSVCYALAAAGLGYFVYTLVWLAPKAKAAIVRLARKNAFADSLLKDYGFRTVVFSAAGLAVNIGYAALQTAVGIASGSVWNIAIAVFYIVLIALKGMTFLGGKRARSDLEKEVKIYRACGCMLNLLTAALIAIIVLMNRTNMRFEYAGLMIYAAAAYTFYKIAASAVQFSKAKRRGGPVVQALRNFNLVDALYSVFVLQVAMIQAFGSAQNALVNNVTGAAAALSISLVGIYMIARSYSLKPPSDASPTDGDGKP